MKATRILAILLMLGGVISADEPKDCISQVAKTKGLIAFWDFSLTKGGYLEFLSR